MTHEVLFSSTPSEHLGRFQRVHPRDAAQLGIGNRERVQEMIDIIEAMRVQQGEHWRAS